MSLMDKSVRNKIRIMVQDLRELLQIEVQQILEGVFGIHTNGKFEGCDVLPAIKDNPTGRTARRGFEYFVNNEVANGATKADAVDKLVLEMVFTHLNRFVGLKLLEKRKVIRETISRGHNSNGFKFYLADHPDQEALWSSGQADAAYRNFLTYQFGVVAEEVKVLFDSDDLSLHVFPRPKAIKEVIDIINREDVIGIWEEDETIGWVYQYFTPKELREQARAESGVPRNSTELAFRNQFYTPRYVVEYLTDNTLGRTWYEMRKGETELKETCKYLIYQKEDVFVKESEVVVDSKCVIARAKKDPREIKVLDPACGSGHFLLYAFELLKQIYLEAYYDDDLGTKLQKDYPDLEQFQLHIPKLILENNLFGIDIDTRAIQIAALALWLRAQRDWREMGIKREYRPAIKNISLVCAEPMPGNKEMVEDFARQLRPTILGQLVTDVWQKIKLAGELGSLLKIDEEIKESIGKAKQAWDKETQTTLFPDNNPVQFDLFDPSFLPDKDFWLRSEEMVFEALRGFSAKCVEGTTDYSRKLFAEESVQGFKFIELMLNKYDVVLMNPPFGESTKETKVILNKLYPNWNRNVLCAFIERMLDITVNDGTVGVIFDRSTIVKSTYQKFRQKILIEPNSIFSMADTGWDVLEANVETTTLVFNKNIRNQKSNALFVDLRETVSENKGEVLSAAILNARVCFNFTNVYNVYIKNVNGFRNLPNSVIGYDMPQFMIQTFNSYPALFPSYAKAGRLVDAKSEFYFRNFWEVPKDQIGSRKRWNPLYNGGPYSKFYLPFQHIVYWDFGKFTKQDNETYHVWNKQYLFSQNLCYGKRGEFLDCHVLPKGMVCGKEGLGVFLHVENLYWEMLSLINSSFIQYSINLYTNIHKQEGNFNLLPIKIQKHSRYAELSRLAYQYKRNWYSGEETNYHFEKPLLISMKNSKTKLSEIIESIFTIESNNNTALQEISREIDEITYALYNLSDEDLDTIKAANARCPQDILWREMQEQPPSNKALYHIDSLLSYYLGVFFGRWDYVNGSFLDKKHFINGLRQVRDLRELMIQKDQELCTTKEITSEPVKFNLSNRDIEKATFIPYPFEVDEDGIIPVDDCHPEDLIAKIEYALGVTFGEELTHELLDEIEKNLGTGLREYFTKKFFDLHVTRYQKKPIYWLLQSSQKAFSAYIYYHKLNRDSLFKVIQNYLEPKLNIVEERLREINSKLAFASERERRFVQGEKAKVEEILIDLQEFKSSLLKILELGYEPQIEDGIIVNIAPFKEVIPWREVQKYWNELESGNYDWSKMALKMWPERVIKKCKREKALAVIHSL